EGELENICLSEKLGVIPYFALASGFLTGKYRSENDRAKSVRGTGVLKYLNEKGKAILHALDEISSKHKTTPASAALAWLMARPSITAPIASTTSVVQLKDLTDAASLKLDEKDIALLNSASIPH